MRRFGLFCKVCLGLLKGSFQLLYGAWKIGRLESPMVTIFGGSRLSQDSPYTKKAHELGHMLVRENISVITGGGPGVMKAASCGATYEIQKQLQFRSIGIAVKGLDQEQVIECAQEYIVLDYFFARKWLMINYSVAFAILPGGFGTLDEVAEVVTLIQTKKLPGVPIVLIGTEFWAPLMAWLKDTVLKQGLITQDDLNLIKVTDDLQEAMRLIKERCDICNIPVHKLSK